MGYNDKPSVSLSDLIGNLAESANNSTKSANLFIKNRRIKENEEHKKLWSQKIIFTVEEINSSLGGAGGKK